MGCLLKNYVKEASKSFNLSQKSVNIFHQDYISKYGETNFKIENFYEYIKNQTTDHNTIVINDDKLFDSLDDFYKNETQNGLIIINNTILEKEKENIDKIKSVFGETNVSAWEDLNNSVHIKVNQPVNKDDDIYHEHETTHWSFRRDEKLQELKERQKEAKTQEEKDNISRQNLIDIISSIEENPNYNGIIQMLKERSKEKKKLLEGVNIQFDEFDNSYYETEHRRRRAYYNPKDKTIHIDNLANFNGGNSDSVVMHEIMHAITVDKILKNDKFRNEIQRYINIFLEYNPSYNRIYNGKHGIEEFVADAWSNPDVINKLKQIKSTNTLTLWDKIKKFFVELFAGANGTLLADVSDSIYKLLDETSYSIDFNDRYFEQEEQSNTEDIDIEDDGDYIEGEELAEKENEDIYIEGKKLEEVELNSTIAEVDKNSIHNKIHQWKNNRYYTASEKRELSETIIQFISHTIKSWYNNPNTLLKGIEAYKKLTGEDFTFGLSYEYLNKLINDAKEKEITREQFVKKLKYQNIFKFAKETFIALQDTDEEKNVIRDNWDAIIFNGRKILQITEHFTISPRSEFIELQDETGEENADETTEDYTGKEEENSESYDIKADTRSATKSLSNEIKNVLYCIPIEGSCTRWYTPRFENGESLANKLIEMLHSYQTIDEMIKKLEEVSSVYKWVNPLLKELKTTPNLKQLFYKDMRKSLIIRAIPEYNSTTGKLEFTVINYDKEIINVKIKNFNALWNNGFRCRVMTAAPAKSFEKEKEIKYFKTQENEKDLKKCIEVLSSKNETVENVEQVAKNLRQFLKFIGIQESVDVISDLISDKNKNVLYDGDLHTKYYVLKANLKNIYSSLKSISGEANPLKLQNGNIEQYAKEIFNLFKPYERVWIEKSTMQKGKNYYGYIYPSFINDLFDVFKNIDSKSDEEYIENIKAIYNDDYLIDKNGEFKNLFLRELVNPNKDFRTGLEKIQLLTYLEGEEILNMNKYSAIKCDISFFLNNSDGKYSYYNCGCFSNKEQIQYTKFFKYDSLNDMKEPFYSVLKQELDRMRDVVSRAKSKNLVRVAQYDINSDDLEKINVEKLTPDSLRQIKKSGAVFKHLSFLNYLLYGNNSFSDEIINILNNNIDDYDGTKLKSEFFNLFKPVEIFDKFFEEEKERLKENYVLSEEVEEYEENEEQEIEGRTEIKFDFTDEEIKNFAYNDFFAQIQLSQIFQIDLAYNKNAEDNQKRAAAFVAPGLKLDTTASFFDKNLNKEIQVSDGKMRTIVIDTVKAITDSIGVIERIFTEKANKFFPGKSKEAEALKNILITRLKLTYGYIDENGKQHGGFDSADGQSWMSPTGFWKKLVMQGKADPDTKRIIDEISSGNLNINHISKILGEPQKPVVYGFQHLEYKKDFSGNFKNKCIPTYIKDSEITLLLADAIIRGAKEDSILTGLFNFMENSHYDKVEKLKDGTIVRTGYKWNGVDNVSKSSTVKLGLTGTVDLSEDKINAYIKKHKNSNVSEAVEALLNEKAYTKDGEYNKDYVIELSFNDYRVQQEVPAHLRNHKQQLGSQNRILSIIDINPEDVYQLYGRKIKGYELQKLYLKHCEEYFKEAKKDIEERFGITSERRASWLNKIQKKILDVEDEKNKNVIIKKIAFNELYNKCKKGQCSFEKAFGTGITNETIENSIKVKKGKKYINFKKLKFHKGCFFNSLINSNKTKKDKKGNLIPNWEAKDCEYSRGEKTLILSNILVNQINSDSRYDSELIYAVSLNEDGKFNIPLNDPINHTRMEQFLCSIVKKDFNKQKIDGGPVVQVSSYGLSKKLNIRYFKKGSRTELIKTKSEFELDKSLKSKYKTYENYQKNEAGGLAYQEVAMTIPWDSDIISKLIIKEGERKGQLMTPQEAIEKGIITDEMLYSIGYRIPTENKSSIYPMKIVDFIPEGIGTCIMLPEEIVAITGSDFDIDKTFIMFKSFHKNKNGEISEYSYEKGDRSKKAINNSIFDIQMAIYQDEKTSFLMHNPQGFDNIKKAQLLAQIKKSKIGKYKDKILTYRYLHSLNIKELEDIVDDLQIGNANKNIHLASIRALFFEKNMKGRQLLGMFANNNTAHGFCQIHNQILRNDPKNDSEKDGMYIKLFGDVILNGITFNNNENKLTVDEILNRDKTYYISSAAGEFVGASADIAKDDVLSEFNADPVTLNMIMLLIRAGFDHDFVCMFVNQPIFRHIVTESNYEKKLNNWLSKYKSDHNINEDDYFGHKYTTEELFSHLNDEVESDYQYFIAKTISKLYKPSRDLLTVSLECRYNSIKNGVGPSLMDNLLNNIKHKQFVADSNITIANSNDIVERNPLLNILYEAQYGDNSIVKNILDKYSTEYTPNFYELINMFIITSGLKINNSSKKAFKEVLNEYNFFRLTNEVKYGEKILPPFFDQRKTKDGEKEINNMLYWYNFPGTFFDIKRDLYEHGIVNDFMNMLYMNDMGDLCMNTKRMKALEIDTIKSSIEELTHLDTNDKDFNEEIKNWIIRSFMYFLQKKGFDFDPNGDITIYPIIFKDAIKYNNISFYEYTRNPNYGLNSSEIENDLFLYNFMMQFFRNNSDLLPNQKTGNNNGRRTLHRNEFKWEKSTVKNENDEEIKLNYIVISPLSKPNENGDYFPGFSMDSAYDNKYIPILKVNDELYEFSKYEGGKLYYKQVSKLGNKNMKEYDATTLSSELNPIRKLRYYINPFNKMYNPENLEKFNEGLYKLYMNNEVGKLAYIYHVLSVGDTYKEILITEEVKEEIFKMIKGTRYEKISKDFQRQKDYIQNVKDIVENINSLNIKDSSNDNYPYVIDDIYNFAKLISENSDSSEESTAKLKQGISLLRNYKKILASKAILSNNNKIGAGTVSKDDWKLIKKILDLSTEESYANKVTKKDLLEKASESLKYDSAYNTNLNSKKQIIEQIGGKPVGEVIKENIKFINTILNIVDDESEINPTKIENDIINGIVKEENDKFNANLNKETYDYIEAGKYVEKEEIKNINDRREKFKNILYLMIADLIKVPKEETKYFIDEMKHMSDDSLNQIVIDMKDNNINDELIKDTTKLLKATDDQIDKILETNNIC